MSEWEKQFKRIIRALAKVERPNRDEDVELDDLYVFFQNCWHLKDWIANDDNLPQGTRDAIVRTAEAMERLKFCADLANGSKHLKLKRFERVGAWLGRMTITSAETGEVLSSPELRYAIVSNSGWANPLNATAFSRKCVEDWKNLLATHGLDTKQFVVVDEAGKR